MTFCRGCSPSLLLWGCTATLKAQAPAPLTTDTPPQRAQKIRELRQELKASSVVVEHLPSSKSPSSNRVDLQCDQAAEALQGSSVNERSCSNTLAPGFLPKAEYRRDGSNRRVFLSDTAGALLHVQTTATLQLHLPVGMKQASW